MVPKPRGISGGKAATPPPLRGTSPCRGGSLRGAFPCLFPLPVFLDRVSRSGRETAGPHRCRHRLRMWFVLRPRFLNNSELAWIYTSLTNDAACSRRRRNQMPPIHGKSATFPPTQRQTIRVQGCKIPAGGEGGRAPFVPKRATIRRREGSAPTNPSAQRHLKEWRRSGPAGVCRRGAFPGGRGR